MTGAWNLEDYPAEESKYIKNEFADGAPCAALYRQSSDASRRIRVRLCEEEDEYLEKIFISLMEIQRILCLKMYDYGGFFAQLEGNEKRGIRIDTTLCVIPAE